MKNLIFLFVFTLLLFVQVSLASSVYGRVYLTGTSGLQLSVSRAVVVIYGTHGEIVNAGYTNNFGYYQVQAPCCDYFVVAVYHRIYDFRNPVRVFNTAWDDGTGFRFDFQVLPQGEFQQRRG